MANFVFLHDRHNFCYISIRFADSHGMIPYSKELGYKINTGDDKIVGFRFVQQGLIEPIKLMFHCVVFGRPANAFEIRMHLSVIACVAMAEQISIDDNNS